MNDIIIGIDLGTTNSEVAIVEAGKITVISDNGRQMLPSFVGMDDNGHIIVGETARNQYLVYPERTVKSIKRLMGQKTQISLNKLSYSPQEISAILLKRLKHIAENHCGQTINKAVITVPAYFSDIQRQATREAGEIAGLEVVRMINEPTAASLTYHSNETESKHILVYDLGGGTFDVSVVNKENGVIEVLSSHGNNQLGGDDFDQKIMNHLIQHIQKKDNVDARQHSKAMARLTRIAENAKIVLSEQPYVQIDEEYLLENNGEPIHLSLELSRTLYEEMIEDDINATIDAVHIALKGANFTHSDIDEIILVGGSTRTPYIRERLFNEIGLEAHSEINTDLCVAMGAAIQGAIIAGQNVDIVLVDVTPYTYGTSALGSLNGINYPYTFMPIIHKNTVLPNQKTEAFMTSYDGQQIVDIIIYQGEDPDALNNVKIGEFRVEGLLDVKAGNLITLTLDLDLNGILHVSAKEKGSDIEKSIIIKNALSQFDGDLLDKAKQRIHSLFGQIDSNPDELIQTESDDTTIPEVKTAQQLITKAKNLFEKTSIENQEDMTEIINALTHCIQTQDIEGLEKHSNELNDIIYYISA